MQQLGQVMTAQEFGLHMALEHAEPLPHAQWSALATIKAAIANGPLQPPESGRIWQSTDFLPEGGLWPDPDAAQAPQAQDQAMTVDQIMARAKLAGMVQ